MPRHPRDFVNKMVNEGKHGLIRPMPCRFQDCPRTFSVDIDLGDHVLAHHGRGGATSGNKIPRPSVKANASPSLWADFACFARFNQYCSRLEFGTDKIKVHELVECLPEEC